MIKYSCEGQTLKVPLSFHMNSVMWFDVSSILAPLFVSTTSWGKYLYAILSSVWSWPGGV